MIPILLLFVDYCVKGNFITSSLFSYNVYRLLYLHCIFSVFFSTVKCALCRFALLIMSFFNNKQIKCYVVISSLILLIE